MLLEESFVFLTLLKHYREIGNILWRYNIIYSRPDIKNDNITSIIKQPVYKSLRFSFHTTEK